MSDDSAQSHHSRMQEGVALCDADGITDGASKNAASASFINNTDVDNIAAEAPSASPEAEAAEAPATAAPLCQRDIDQILHSANKTHRTAVKTLEVHGRIAVMPISSYARGERGCCGNTE